LRTWALNSSADAAAPADLTDSVGFGVYVHVPFCSHRCDYCAFATWTDRAHLVDAHTAATIQHLRRSREAGQLPAASSVFFGGGTPSLLPPASLVSILDAIERLPGAEVTVECNPDNVSLESLQTYRAGGVTRLSFGVQSMVDRVLLSLGRRHDRANVERAVGWARQAGFETFNLDLIYGGAGETMQDWEATIDAVLALDPPHISAYGLTVEAGTPLALDTSRHPDDDDLADKYLLATERFGAAGLDSYEISNWARTGHECRHNWLYWMQGDYLGVGCAAHSHRQGRRWWNLRTPDRYVEAAETGASFEATGESLTPEVRELERLQLRLRTRLGVPLHVLSPEDRTELAHLLVIDRDSIRLTAEGRLLANEVAHRLIA
jgi:putative oxygen-independent coproporphyrinogen III oxidase